MPKKALNQSEREDSSAEDRVLESKKVNKEIDQETVNTTNEAIKTVLENKEYTLDEIISGLENGRVFGKKEAMMLIRSRKMTVFTKNIKKFIGLDNEVVDLLFKFWGYKIVVNHAKKFTGINYENLFERLLQIGNISFAVKNIKKFPFITLDEIPEKLIEMGLGSYIRYNIKILAPLNEKVEEWLVKTLSKQELLDIIPYISDNARKRIALDIIDRFLFSLSANCLLWERLIPFAPFDQEVLNEILEKGHLERFETPMNIAKYLYLFPGVDQKRILDRLISLNLEFVVAQYIKNFTDTDPMDFAQYLFAAKKEEYIAACLENFPSIDQRQLAKTLLGNGKGKYLAECFSLFSEISPNEIARDLISQGNEKALAENLMNYKNLNMEIAILLIQKGYIEKVIEFLDSFSDIDYEEIAREALLINKGSIIFKREDKLSVLSDETVILFIHAGHYELVAKTLGSLLKVDKEKIIEAFFEYGKAFAIPQFLENFSITNFTTFAERLIEADAAKEVIRYFEKFVPIDSKKIINLLLTKPELLGELTKNIKKFPSLKPEKLAKRLAETSQEDVIISNFSLFPAQNATEVVLRFLKSGGDTSTVIYNLKYLSNLDYKEVGPLLVQNTTPKGLTILIDWLPQFLHKPVAMKLLRTGNNKILIEEREKFILEARDFSEIYHSYLPVDTPREHIESICNMPETGLYTVNGIALLFKQYPQITYKKEVSSILNSQGDGAFRIFSVLEEMKDLNLDIQFLVSICKRTGVKALSVFSELLYPLITEQKFIPDTVEKQKIFYGYLEDVELVSPEIFEKYIDIVNESFTKEKDLMRLKKTIQSFRKDIADGEDAVSHEEEKKIWEAVLYDVFPPAIGIKKEEMLSLYASREDRQSDVDHIFQEKMPLIEAKSSFSVSTGKMVLESGAELDMRQWNQLSEVIREVHKEEKEGVLEEDLSNIGTQLIEWYRSPEPVPQKALWKLMYRHEVIGGMRLSETPGFSITELMKYKEFIGDRIKSDYVKKSIQAYTESFPKEYTELCDQLKSRISIKDITNVAMHVWKMRETYVSKPSTEIDQKFRKIWQDKYLLTVDEVLAVENKEELEEILSVRMKKDISEELPRMIGVKLVQETNDKMLKELNKFNFETSGKEKERELHFVISKRKSHSLAGYNMGVCVAPDKKLWNTPEFMNAICFDTEMQRAMGGMHFYFVTYEGEKYLSLPGINPSLDLLSVTKAKDIYDKFIEFAVQIAKIAGCKSIWIPESSSIHSNRTQIIDIIREKQYQKRSLEKEIAFSYDPHPYTYRDVYIIPLEDV
ncbi:MAG: hypothetical protein ACK4NC_04420 [Candidatus Gracilibacteria bacterium]